MVVVIIQCIKARPYCSRCRVSCCAGVQVSRQLASKCAELTRCQSELQQVQHMLAAAYAANAAMQVRFTQASQLP